VPFTTIIFPSVAQVVNGGANWNNGTWYTLLDYTGS